MTTLRNEIRQTIFEYLEKYYQDNPTSVEATQFNRDTSVVLAEDVLDIFNRENAILKDALRDLTDSLFDYIFKQAKSAWATDDVAKQFADDILKKYRDLL